MSGCSPQCYTSPESDGDCKCVCGGANHGQGAGGVPAVSAEGEVIDRKPPAGTQEPMNVDARQLSTPQAQSELLDQLTLQNIAHNLHYATRGGYEEARSGSAPPTFDETAARAYVCRHLNLIYGIRDPDEGMVDAAIERWHALYPQDHLDGAQPIRRPQAEGALPAAADGPSSQR